MNRSVKRLMGVASIVVVLVVLLLAGSVIENGGVPQARAHALTPCAITIWHTEKQNPWLLNGDWTQELTGLQSLRDLNTNQYCGQVRGTLSFTEPSGACHTFYIGIRRASDAYLLTYHLWKPACGTSSSIYVYYAAGVGEYDFASSWVDSWPKDEYDTPPWPVS